METGIIAEYDTVHQVKTWRLPTVETYTYRGMQATVPIIENKQVWVLECSSGDNWFGIAKKHDEDRNQLSNLCGEGIGVWPENAFTLGNNYYVEDIFYSEQLFIFMHIDPIINEVNWKLYSSPKKLPVSSYIVLCKIMDDLVLKISYCRNLNDSNESRCYDCSLLDYDFHFSALLRRRSEDADESYVKLLYYSIEK